MEEVLEDPRASGVRVPVLRDLAAIYDERLIDPVKAERTFRRLLTEAEGDRDTTLSAAVALERLYRALQNPRGLVDALRLRAKHESDPTLQTSLLAQAAEILEDEVGDLAGAVDAQRGRLDLDAGDLDALRSLARLYERSGQWEELVKVLRRQAALVDDGESQKRLLVQAASVLEEKLAAVPEAIALYEDVLTSFGPDRAIHAALARLLEVSDQWPGLLAVVERDLAIVEDPTDRLALMVRAADLRYRKTGEPLLAVLGYQEALSLDPTTPTARAALTEMLRSDLPEVPIAAARALEPVLRADGDWSRLVDVLDRIAAESDDRDERLQALSKAAEVSEMGLSDPGRAFERASRALALAAEDPDAAAGAHVGVARGRGGRHKEMIAVFREVAPRLLDAELQRDVYMHVAGTALSKLGDPATAREHFEKALENQSDFMPALDALESLHESTQAWTELLAVLRRKVELAETDEARKGAPAQGRAHPGGEARRPRRRQRGLRGDPRDRASTRDSAAALERLYAQASAGTTSPTCWSRSSPATAPTSPPCTTGSAAWRWTTSTTPSARFEHFRAVLDESTDHEPTVSALEELGRRPELAARVATMLEPIYRARQDMPKLIGALEARIAAESDVYARKELLSRLGTLYEENLGDLARALDTHARIFREDPTDRATWQTLDRLARATDAHPKLAEAYAATLEGITVDDDNSADLSFVAARLFDERVNDTARARGSTTAARWRSTAAAREVFDALEALLSRESAHTELLELYRDAAERAVDPVERKGFLHKIAAIDEGPLDNPERAIADYRAVLDVDPMDEAAIARLDALLVKTAAWRDLADLLERRIADAVDVRGALGAAVPSRAAARRPARRRPGRGRGVPRDPGGPPRPPRGHPVARAARRDEARAAARDRRDPRARLPRARRLGAARGRARSAPRIHQRSHRPGADLQGDRAHPRDPREATPKLAFEAFSAAFAGRPRRRRGARVRRAPRRRARALGRAGRQLRGRARGQRRLVLNDRAPARHRGDARPAKRGDPRAAIVAFNRLFDIDDSQLDVLDQLEGLHVLLSDWEGHIEVLERKVARSLDDDHRRFLLHTVGESQRDMLNNPGAAIHAFRRALELDPTDLIALEALDGLLSQRGDHRGLAEVLQQRLDVEADAEARTETALRLGRLWERSLDDPHHAIDAYRRALDESAHAARGDPRAGAALRAQSMLPRAAGEPPHAGGARGRRPAERAACCCAWARCS